MNYHPILKAVRTGVMATIIGLSLYIILGSVSLVKAQAEESMLPPYPAAVEPWRGQSQEDEPQRFARMYEENLDWNYPASQPYPPDVWGAQSLRSASLDELPEACAGNEGTGTITGTIRAADTGQPLSRYEVYAVRQGVYERGTATDVQGNYLLPDLPGGVYTVRVYPRDRYAGLWYGGQTSQALATPFTVSADITLTNINVTLPIAGKISGTVSAAEGGVGIQHVYVTAYNTNGDSVAYATTSVSGTYQINGLPSGSYRVCFGTEHRYISSSNEHRSYFSECYSGKPSLEEAESLVIVSEQTTTVNAALKRGGRILGRITAEDSSLGLAGVDVYLSSDSGNWYTSVDANGYYTSPALPTGSYKIEFDTRSSGTPYIGEWYNDKASSPNADQVLITSTKDVTINAALSLGGQIRGRVLAADTQQGLEEIYIYFSRLGGNSSSFVSSKADGSYASFGLSPGVYTVRFTKSHPYSPSYAYIGKNYSTTVTIVGTSVVDLLDVLLERGEQICGRVTDSTTGKGIYGFDLRVYDAHGKFVQDSYSWDLGGLYITPGLPKGSYKLRFETGLFNQSNYIDEWSGDQPDFSNAQIIPLTGDGVTAGVNVALDKGGQIVGKISSADTGELLNSASVIIYDANTGTWIDNPYMRNGRYATKGLPIGNYKVLLSAPYGSNYVGEWYADGNSEKSATTIAITNLQQIEQIDASLASGGYVRGKVTSAETGNPLEGVAVTVFDVNSGESVAYASSDRNGEYTTSGIASGTYSVMFRAPSSASSYLYEWYNDKSTEAQAERLSLTAPNAITGINAALAKGGQISGRVLAADSNAPLPDVYVYVYDAVTNEYVAYGRTDATGAYTTAALYNGSYKLLFRPNSSGESASYALGWYADKLDRGVADAVTVSTSTLLTGYDIKLPKGSTIRGVVTANLPSMTRTSTQNISYGGVTVCAYSINLYEVACTTSDSNGVYELILRPGSYRLGFTPPTGSNYAASYLGGATTLEASPLLTLSTDADLNDVNMVLNQRPPGTEIFLPLVSR